MRSRHMPVLLEPVVDLLAPGPGAVVMDCTGAGGGHARALAERMDARGRLLVLDRDESAVRGLRETLKGLPPEIECFHEDFRNLDRVLARTGLAGVDRMLADIGLSSDQLEDPARGFSFQNPGKLDMRFDRSVPGTAEDWVNRASTAVLAGILWDYGEERYARRVAAAIVQARPIADTVTLAEVIRRAVPRGTPGLDRATRSFQALRIAVNDELGALEDLLEKGLDALNPGGRMAVISFQGLETKRVKAAFRGAVRAGRVSLLTPKPVRPGRAEVVRNPRSRSAVLRCVEKVVRG